MGKKKAKRKTARPGEGVQTPTASKRPAGKWPTAARLRKQIDALDQEILRAISERAEAARELARRDGEGKGGATRPTFEPVKDEEVLKRAAAENPGPLPAACVQAVFREILSGSRALEAPTRVAYLGPEFTFSHLAALRRFGQSAELVPVSAIASVFEEVERGHAQFGVVPLENSTDGRISDTLEGFSHSPVRICGELPLRIHHCLLGLGPREGIRTVYSKPQALSQCRNWLARHLPSAQVQGVASTAEAAQNAAQDHAAAAVASEQVAAIHNLSVLARDIEDQANNVTRFAVIAAQPAEPSGHDKTALMFEIPHEPGALADAMVIFKRKGLNMTWIESFPIPGSRGRYLFFVEFLGHQRELRARRAIEMLRKKCVRLDVLGSYAHMEPME